MERTPTAGPGTRRALSGRHAIECVEAAASEGFAAVAPDRDRPALPPANAFGRRSAIDGATDSFAAAIGLVYTGLRAAAFVRPRDRGSLPAQLAACSTRRLPLVVHVGCRNHDDLEITSRSGCFQLFSGTHQEAVDFTLIAHRIAELSLTPGVHAFDIAEVGDSVRDIALPDAETVRAFLGDPDDDIAAPTSAQRVLFGPERRRVPTWFSFDHPTLTGAETTGRAGAAEAAARRPFFDDHLPTLAERAMREFADQVGRHYEPVSGYRTEDAHHILIATGATAARADRIVDHLRDTDRARVGCVKLNLVRPFLSSALVGMIAGRKSVTLLERAETLLTDDGPLAAQVRAALDSIPEKRRPPLFAGRCGLGGTTPTDGELLAAFRNMTERGRGKARFYIGVDFPGPGAANPKREALYHQLRSEYPDLDHRALPAEELHRPEPPARTTYVLSGTIAEIGAAVAAGLHAAAPGPVFGRRAGDRDDYEIMTATDADADSSGGHPFDTLVTDLESVHRVGQRDAASGAAVVVATSGDENAVWARLTASTRRRVLANELTLWLLPTAADPTASEVCGTLLSPALGPATRSSATMDQVLEAVGEHLSPDLVRRGWEAVRAVDCSALPSTDAPEEVAADNEPPLAARRYREGGPPVTRLSRFWSHGVAERETTAGPFEACSVLPPATSAFFDATTGRTHLPRFIGSACTGCGLCFTHCAHSAIPPIVIGIESLLRAGAEVATERGATITQFTPHFRGLARRASRALASDHPDVVGDFLPAAFDDLVEHARIREERRAALRLEFDAILDVLREFPVAVTERFFTLPEARSAGSGELFSVAVNPQACTGCNACVDVCPEEALVAVPQTDEEVARRRDAFRLWEALPDSPGETIRRMREDPEFGPIAATLLSRNFSMTLVGGDAAQSASGERSLLHWIVSVVESLVQPEALALSEDVEALVARLSGRLREVLGQGLPVDDLDALSEAVSGGESAELGGLLDRIGHGNVVDRTRVARLVDLLRSLSDLRWALTEGPSGTGRARLGITIAPGPHLGWGRRHPRNPFCFPVTVQWDPAAPDFATGLCLGHLRHRLDNLRLVRRARLEADGRYDPDEHDAAIAGLGWRDLTDDEWKTVQPVLLVADARTLISDGLDRLAALLAGDVPVKVVLLDERGGGSGVVSPALAMMHRNAFVLQASAANPAHLFEGLADGLRSRRPALFHVHVPQHAVPGSPTALESRAFPCVRFDPDRPGTFGLRLSLDGNPEPEAGWTQSESNTAPLTYADWAATEPRFREHFSPLAPDTEGATPMHEFITLESDARRDRVPFVQVAGSDEQLDRLRASPTMVRWTEDALAAWTVLQEVAGVVTPFTESLRERLRAEVGTEHAADLAALKAEYEERIADLDAEHARKTAAAIRERLLALAGYQRSLAEPRDGDGAS